ncbi:MAG TPA: hypothetical protein H9759_02650 [Candidatus Dietzia intestinipullorum]|nr:hypothetical protein [Candidatus Dietzia intestinipullorum]
MRAGRDGPAVTGPLTVAVLGPKDSAAPAVSAALSAEAGAAVRVIVDAGPGDRPDIAVLVVDAVCPIRPDDLEVARGVASRVPVVVVLAGRVATCEPGALTGTVDVTTRRLAEAGVRAPVHVVDERVSGSGAALLAAVTELASARRSTPAPHDGPGPAARPGRTVADADHRDAATVDWLLARRTEAITSRSQALRQDVQALRIEVVQDLHRSVRELGGRARDEIGSASRSRTAEVVRVLSDDADAAVAGAIARADRRVHALVTRHLGPTAPATPRIPAPTGGITVGSPPRNRGDEALVMAMGAAGGIGVGRMLLSPLAEMPGMAAVLVPLALLCGLTLGCVTVTVRRTQALRTHSIAVVTDRLAGLRAEVEQSLGSRILAAESTITDGFAHDPGPRVADLERRIRRLRLAGSTPPARSSVRSPAPSGHLTPATTASAGSPAP